MAAKLTPIMIFVKDFGACLEFYCKAFDLEPVKPYAGKEHSDYAEFEVGEKIHLALHGDYDGAPHKQGEPIALHFEVQDIRRTLELVKEHGGSLVQDIRKLDFRGFAENQLVEDARVTDPDGNELELRQVLEERNS